MSAQSMIPMYGAVLSSRPWLYSLSITSLRYSAALCDCGCVTRILHYLSVPWQSFKDLLVEALEMYYRNPSITVLEMLFQQMNGVDLRTTPLLNTTEQLFLKVTSLVPMTRAIEQGEFYPLPPPQLLPVTEIAVDLIMKSSNEEEEKNEKLSVYIPISLTRCPDEVGDINVSRLIGLFGESTMRIFNAILARQRILFVGYNHAAKDIAQMVFSAVALCSPAITGVIRRAVPYATLSDLSFLQVY